MENNSQNKKSIPNGPISKSSIEGIGNIGRLNCLTFFIIDFLSIFDLKDIAKNI